MTKKELRRQLAAVAREINRAPNNYWSIIWDVERAELSASAEADSHTYTVHYDCEMITVAMISPLDPFGDLPHEPHITGAWLLRMILYQELDGADRLPLKGDVWGLCP